MQFCELNLKNNYQTFFYCLKNATAKQEAGCSLPGNFCLSLSSGASETIPYPDLSLQ